MRSPLPHASWHPQRSSQAGRHRDLSVEFDLAARTAGFNGRDADLEIRARPASIVERAPRAGDRFDKLLDDRIAGRAIEP